MPHSAFGVCSVCELFAPSDTVTVTVPPSPALTIGTGAVGVGTPFCVTVDGQTLEDNTVTVRHRDTMQQERVAIDKLPALVEEECSYRKLFRKLNL